MINLIYRRKSLLWKYCISELYHKYIKHGWIYQNCFHYYEFMYKRCTIWYEKNIYSNSLDVHLDLEKYYLDTFQKKRDRIIENCLTISLSVVTDIKYINQNNIHNYWKNIVLVFLELRNAFHISYGNIFFKMSSNFRKVLPYRNLENKIW